MKGIIYKYTFPDGKVYIGQTRRPLSVRHQEHISPSRGPLNPGFWKAYTKFKSYQLEELEVIEKENYRDLINELNHIETFYITKYKATLPEYGYNIRDLGTSSCPDNKLLDDEFTSIWQVIASEIYPDFYFIMDKISSNHNEELTVKEIDFIKTNLLENNIFSEPLKEWMDETDFSINADNEEDREMGLFWLDEALEFAEMVICDENWEIIRQYVSQNEDKIIKKRSVLKIYRQIDLEGRVINEFSSKEDIYNEFNISRLDNIINVIKGRQKTAYGYKWELIVKEPKPEDLVWPGSSII